MKVLIGTTNPSKVKRFEDLLSDCNIEFITLKDLNIKDEPLEVGSTPEENAVIKARFYGQYFDKVICNDSGLYFDSLPLDDIRQPGLNIRSPRGHRLDDEGLIKYYSELVCSLGGKVLAYYLDGIAVYDSGNIYSFMENSEDTRNSSFYLVNNPSDKRHEGWPLDSISVNRKTGTYFVEKTDDKYDSPDENIMLGDYRKRLIGFLKCSLGICPKDVDGEDAQLILIRPTAEYAERIMDCKNEYLAAGSSMDGCGPLRSTDDPKEYIEKILIEENPETCPPPLVPATQFMLVRKSDDKILGFLQVRHCFNDYLEQYGGHIGYSVRPTERRKGYAKTMLGLALPYCKKIGLEKVLITCIDGNIGSEKTILANGGVYDRTVHEPNNNIDLKRFWITL